MGRRICIFAIGTAVMVVAGCGPGKQADGNRASAALGGIRHIEISSADNAERRCFVVSDGLNAGVIEGHELMIRFNDAMELLEPSKRNGRFGERIAALFVFSNEGQKMGAMTYAATRKERIDLGRYILFSPSADDVSQALVVQKAGGIGISYYPATTDIVDGKVEAQAALLAKFVDQAQTACKQ